jgi:hypothetical protein
MYSDYSHTIQSFTPLEIQRFPPKASSLPENYSMYVQGAEGSHESESDSPRRKTGRDDSAARLPISHHMF